MIEEKLGYVTSTIHTGVVTIEFFHPQSNSLPSSLLENLAKAIHTASNVADTKVILIKSAGQGAFCAGASFEELSSIKTKEEGLNFFSGFAHVINAMRVSSKLIVGRIHGTCVGGGVGLAAAMDYAIAVDGADIKLSELHIGIGPFVVGPVIERKIGVAAFSQLAIDAAMWRNADWAKRKGLYAELHPGIAEMEESINKLLFTLSHSNPAAMMEMKKIFWSGTEHWTELLLERAAMSGSLVLSDFTKKALLAAKKK